MAKIFRRFLSAMLAILMCTSVLSVGAFAIDSNVGATWPIDKTATPLTNDDQTDVTLVVPGTVEGYVDVVFILGGGMTANMKTIESAINVFKPMMESGKATVRLGLISLEKGKEIILDLNSDEAVLDPDTYVEFITEKFDSINDLPYGTTNLHSQMLEAQKMLAAETKAKAENKYVFVLATGRTYWFDDANGEQATIVNKVNNTYYWGNYLWQSQRGRHTSLYMIPGRYNDSYEAFFADIEKWVAADGDKYVYTPHFDVNDYSAYVTWEQANNKDLKALKIASSRFGNGIVNPKPTAANFITGVEAGGSSGNNPSMALNYERAQYECVQVWKQLVASGYNCYSICSETPYYQNNSEYIDYLREKNPSNFTPVGNSNSQLGHSFMNYLAELAGQKEAPTVWEFEYVDGVNTWNEVLDENFFETIREDLLYTCSSGSTVEDFIGKNENGNFEFIENADYITLNVGGVDYVTTQVETKEGANSSYAFTKHFDDCGDDCDCVATFWLDYYYGDGETTERFVWTFGESVSMERLASLTYKLLLTDKLESEGTYEVPTNNSATLYPVDSDGNEGDPMLFPVPTVTYTVVEGTDIVIKKIDETGKPLSGVKFELFAINGENKTSLGEYTVDNNGELVVEKLKVGSYELVETVTPNGYIGLSDSVRFDVIYTADKFEVVVYDEYILNFPATSYEISNHAFYPAIPQTFVLLDADKAATWEYTGEYVLGASDYHVVYCADSTTGCVNGTTYNKYALEDVFDAEAAGKLRAIIANSYPYVSMEDMVDAAVAAGVADAENLTRGDIIAAVQLAIWNYTNGGGYTYRNATYSVPNYPQWGKVFHDYTDELPDYLPKNTTKKINDTAGAKRIDALYSYLVNLSALTVKDSAINAVCYIAKDGKGASQSLIGAERTSTTIVVKNYAQYDVDIVLALGAGIAKYDGVNSSYSHTYDSIINLVESLVLEGHNVKLGLVAVEHYDDVAMELTALTKENYKRIILSGLEKIQQMPAGPTNLHGNIVAAKEMLDADTDVPAKNKFFYVIATGRTYNYDNADGVPTTIINKIALKGNTYYYWGHYLWQSQRGGHTSLYMIPARYNNDFAAYWADVEKWVAADGDTYAYSFTDVYNTADPQWFNNFYSANTKDAKALGLASSRFGWILTGLTNSGLAAIGSGSNPQNALNYERAQYEAYQAYQAMLAAGYNCEAICSESPNYQNGSEYITQGAKYTGASTIQLGHSFMDFLNGGKATVLFDYFRDENGKMTSTAATFKTTDYFTAIDMAALEKSEKSSVTVDRGPIMMSPAPKPQQPAESTQPSVSVQQPVTNTQQPSAGVQQTLAITQQPQDVEAEIGEKFSITVVATGEGLKYQWYYKNKGGSSFAPSSYKSKSYAMTMAEYCHMREVYCVITDANGNSVTSDTVTITRPEIALAITKQPQSVEVAIGEKVSISVGAQGEGLKYQWYYKDKNGSAFAVSSYKSSTYTITMSEYCHMRSVYCVVTDAKGNSVTSEIATMSRPAIELVITQQPQDVEVAIGEKATITVVAQGDGLKYQWYYKDKSGSAFAVSSYKSKSYSMTMAEYCHMRQVYCVITDENGNTVTSEIATMSRPAVALAITAQPQSVTAAIGEKVTITVGAQGDGLKYQWFYKNKNGTSFAASSYKSKSYSITMAEYCNMREVYCVVTDANGNTVTTDIATMIRSNG